MYRLLFSSVACEWLCWADIGALLGNMRHAAGERDLTGVALHDGSRFLFVVEGAFIAANECYERIRTDPRLSDVSLIDSRAITERAFVGWQSACQEVSTIQDARSLAAEVATLAEPVRDTALRRLLNGFVQPQTVTGPPGLSRHGLGRPLHIAIGGLPVLTT